MQKLSYTPDEYQALARETAIYAPIDNHSIVYPVLGLIGESGEIIDKIKKLFRDSSGEVSASDRYGIVMEIGDTFWFITTICDELDLSFAKLVQEAIESAQLEYMHTDGSLWEGELQTAVANYQPSLARSSFRLNAAVGNISALADKYLATDGLESLGTVRFFLADAIASLLAIAKHIEVNLGEIFGANIQKLQYRKQTNKISGSGDYR